MTLALRDLWSKTIGEPQEKLYYSKYNFRFGRLNFATSDSISYTSAHKVETRYVVFRSDTEYFLLPWIIQEKILQTINALS